MPTKKPQWAEMAKASEEELLQYKGIKSSHLVLLEKTGVDVSAYVALSHRNSSMNKTSKAAIVQESQKKLVAEKRQLLLEMAKLAALKVEKGLKAAQAHNAQALQLSNDTAVAEAARAAAPAALQRAKARDRAELNMLQQQGQGLQDLPKHVGQFAMALATLGGAAPAPAEDDGDTQTPSPEQLPTPTPVPATADPQPTLADRNLGGISFPLEPQKKKQKVALSSPEEAPGHPVVL